ncbi:hypothetical protein MWU75_10735 [Ornithinimicrobium sp. F0845]|uniref:AMIN-like domain-containing (lipo)protein n=1 Tax=Ornithinimicrobium sp. F0845 TaxID=2926412 RepID=UPI001FF133F6|nr:hypothetical protein [Ornithinimicrobium sp. F0845]MCK0112616.1 hypothetical protein [Ornithinimicrobium sp. F0845]
MADRHRRGEAVAVLAAAALALAACGTQTEEDPSLSIGPTGPTDGEDRTDPDATGEPAATTAPSPTTSGPTTDPAATAGPSTSGTSTSGTSTGTGDATVTDVPDPSEVPTTTTEEPAGEAGAEGDPGPLPGFAEETVQQDPTGQAQLIIDGIRLGLQDGFDRVVLDLSGTGEVGWRVEYVDAPALDGSGIPVDLAGDHVLVVSALGMAYPEPGDTTYDELLLVDGGDLTTVSEVLRAVPFEGQVQVYVATRDRVPFRVFRLGDPERLVVDVQHP